MHSTAHIGPRNNGATVTSIKRAGKKYGDCGTGKETLRFKANGSVQIEKEVSKSIRRIPYRNLESELLL